MKYSALLRQDHSDRIIRLNQTVPILQNQEGNMVCRAYYITYGVPVIITHSCNNVEPYQFPEKLIPLFVTNLIQGKKNCRSTEAGVMYGNGCAVLDHAKAIDAILHKGTVGKIYNIGSGVEKTNLQIAHTILSFFEKDMSWIDHVADRLGHDQRYAVDYSLNDKGYRVETNLYIRENDDRNHSVVYRQ